MKVLVIKRDKIGDMLLTTPALAIIKNQLPAVELHVLANSYNGWVVSSNPNVDRLWLYPLARSGLVDKIVAVIQQIVQIAWLRVKRFDWIIVAGGNASYRANRRARLIAGKNGARISAYCETGQSLGISDPLPPPTGGHEVERIVALLAPLGLHALPTDISEPYFSPPSHWIESAKDFLKSHALKPGGYIMLGIGARNRKRQPSPEQVLRWARTLHAQYGLMTTLQWTPGRPDNPLYPGDDDVAKAILSLQEKAGGTWIHPYRGDLNTGVGLIWLAATSIFPDSGLMHLAACSPGGVIGLFADIEHSPPPSVWGPRGVRAESIVASERVADLPEDDILERIAAHILVIQQTVAYSGRVAPSSSVQSAEANASEVG